MKISNSVFASLFFIFLLLNLFSKVLMTYWEMDEFQVEDVLTEFLKKSLAQSEYDPILESYLFHIHDLQLEYLKSQFYAKAIDNDNPNEDPERDLERDLHAKFLDKYFQKAKGDTLF